MEKKGKFKFNMQECQACKVKKERLIDGQWEIVPVVDFGICQRCKNLKDCSASVSLKVHQRLGFIR